MNKKVTATKAKNNFGVLIEEVYSKGNTVIVTKNNKPVAKVIPIKESEYELEPSERFVLNDKEYKKALEGIEDFRSSFNFNF